MSRSDSRIGASGSLRETQDVRVLARPGWTILGTAFSLFALAEISYMTYHLDWTVFLFAHTISEVLDLLAFILVFVAATQRAQVSSSAAHA